LDPNVWAHALTKPSAGPIMGLIIGDTGQTGAHAKSIQYIHVKRQPIGIVYGGDT